MITLANSFHELAENFKIFPLRRKLQGVFLKEGNYYFFKFFPIEHFVAVAVFMIPANVLLKVNAPATKEFFYRVQDGFICFNQLDVETRFYSCSPDLLG